MTTLTLNDATAGYGQAAVLRGISLEVPSGQVVCLLGSNGAGKTTTIRVLNGSLELSAGQVRLDGHDVTGSDAMAMVGRGVATVPEGRRVFPELTVRENLKIGGYHRRRSFAGEAELDAAFEMFPRLKERAGQLGGTLSGGEQQMLAIARALMAKPRVLLLDEPSMGLAPILIQSVFDTIGRLAATGITILLVEQNAEAALEIAAYGYILERGQIVLSGDSQSLRKDPRVQESYLGIV